MHNEKKKKNSDDRNAKLNPIQAKTVALEGKQRNCYKGMNSHFYTE